ncbi:lipid II:glycine glycyltransferase FemX [Archaeoglobus neptunius]|uniref:lipid II:glycine glycyltransferase FemX n=1 Tax=Archaeoglobus neptunius TaxID=2798580 RepID=UPI00192938A6|nr:GNAT family N-acetyltransferase [Archaeoglobus neptunius]
MGVEIELAKDPELWDGIVKSSPHGTIFHLWDWLKIVEGYTGMKLYPLMGYKGSTPIGVYPFFGKKVKFAKTLFSPPPKALLLYLGPVIANYETLKQSKKVSHFYSFQKQVDEYVFSELNANYVRVRSAPRLECRPLIWCGYDVKPLYTYMIRLEKNPEMVWKKFNRKTRVNIEKTKREGVTIEMGDYDDLDYLRNALYGRFEEQGYRPTEDYYREYLNDLMERFYPDNMKIFVAKLNGERVGGLVTLHYRRWAGLWIGIPKTKLAGVYPNDLAQWEAIKWACQEGYEYYELMDSGENPRLVDYKSNFNPEPVPWYSAVKYSSPIFGIAEKISRVIRMKG